jgi:hypothetical protein
MKRFVKGLLLAVGVLVGSSAWAQCVPGQVVYGDPFCTMTNNPPLNDDGGDSGGNGGYVPPTVIHLPTSYGAVALDLKTNTYGYSSKQASEQASKQAALADCGKKGCKVFHTYSNSCTAMAYGWVSGRGNFFMIGDENIQLAQQKALGNCQSQYGNCEIVMSECSLAGQTDGR